MKNLLDFNTPTGAKGNLLNPNDWLKLILGTAVLIITFAMGQNVAKNIGGRVGFVDSQIDKPYAEPTQEKTKPSVRVI